jgi:NAD(P)-dependent dehydrogenase (short-subunit alcohol dehydrogenase family)
MRSSRGRSQDAEVEIRGKAALVTGGSRGIGRAIVERLTEEGADVLIVDVEEPEGAAFFRADVTREDDVEQMIAEADRRFGRLDIVVNNVGNYEEPVFPDAPIEHWTRNLDLNLRSVMLGIHFAVRAMARRGGGAIVSIASSAGLGFAAHPGPEYAAAKAAVMRLTACLAPLAERGIRVNCVCPHTVATEAVRETIDQLQRDGRPLPWDLQGDLLEPEEVADAVVELIQDETLAGRIMVCRGGEPPRLLS